MADRITDEMIAAAAKRMREYMSLLVDLGGETQWADLAKMALTAGLAGRAVVDLPTDRKWVEFCRACRDERDEIVPAEFILWGKLTPPEQLGPRCYNHTADYIGSTAMGQIDQWAVFDLRPLNRALNPVAGGVA